MFTATEIQAADNAFRIHSKGGCADDCGFCYDLLLAREPKYERELKRITDLKATRRAGNQTLVKATKAEPEWTRPVKRKEKKSKFRRR